MYSWSIQECLEGRVINLAVGSQINGQAHNVSPDCMIKAVCSFMVVVCGKPSMHN